MQQGQVVDLDAALALSAARTGDGPIGGVVWTQDEDCDGLADVQFVAKRRGS